MHQVEVVIEGIIDEQWAEWLEGFKLSQLENERTMLTGSVEDQSSFYGLIAKMRDLGLKLLSVHIKAD